MSTRWTSRAAKASSSCSFQKGWAVNPQILWLWVNLSSTLFFFFWRGEIKLLFLNLKFVIVVVFSLSVNGICFTTAYGIVNVQF